MSDKPEIKVGQRWTLLGGAVVTVLSVKALGTWPIIIQHADDEIDCILPDDLISLAPLTVKREVAIFRDEQGEHYILDTENPLTVDCWFVSEPLTIEFTLLPGECAE